jgi:hypothetical protein
VTDNSTRRAVWTIPRRLSVSFAAMAVLIFIAIQFLTYSRYSSGPNLDLSLGWLELHWHGEARSVDHFRLGALITAVFLSIVLTWTLSKLLRRSRNHRSAA